MGRPSGPKVRCNNQWSEARYNTYIRNILRQGSMRWGPKHTAKKKANISRGVYLCACCNQHVPSSIRIEGKRKRVNNVFVDHINPIVDPEKGFEGFDVFIERLFCEEDNLQVLCGTCHDEKSVKERALAAETRKNNKENL